MRRNILILLMFFTATGCAQGMFSNDDGDSDKGTLMGLDAYHMVIEHRLATTCEIESRCPTPSGFQEIAVPTDSTAVCASFMKARSLSQGGDPGLYNAFVSGHALLYTSKLETCAKKMLEGECTDVWARLHGSLPQECLDMVKGILQEGQECHYTEECAPGLYCSGCPGTCQPRKGAGGSCTTDEQCAQGLVCLGSCVAQEIVPQGGACGEAGQVCEYGTSCIKGPDGTKTCTPWLGPGTQCDPNGTPACKPGMGCEPTSRVCVPVMTASGEGDECDGVTILCDSRAHLACLGEECHPLPIAGSPCLDGRCWEGHTCDASQDVCLTIKDAGEQCENSLECGSNGSCNAGQCYYDDECAE